MISEALANLPLLGTCGAKRRQFDKHQIDLARWIVRRTDLIVFTHNVAKAFWARMRLRAIIPASWIDERDILSEENARSIWAKKLADTERLRVLFAGRLMPDKGLLVLLDAMMQTERSGRTHYT
jgi:hypothetical protein